MKIELHKPEFGEDKRGVLQAILSMPDSVRYAFYESSAGQVLIKGLELVAENDKDPKDALGDKREWSKEDIDELIQKLHEASPEQKEIIFQLLPGPIIGVIRNRLSSPDYKPRSEQAKIEGLDKGVRGPVKGTPGYFQWLERLRATRAAKRAVTDAAKKSPTAPGGGFTKPVAGKKDKKKTQPEFKEKKERSYKHFVRRVGKEGKIQDEPVGEKE